MTEAVNIEKEMSPAAKYARKMKMLEKAGIDIIDQQARKINYPEGVEFVDYSDNIAEKLTKFASAEEINKMVAAKNKVKYFLKANPSYLNAYNTTSNLNEKVANNGIIKNSLVGIGDTLTQENLVPIAGLVASSFTGGTAKIAISAATALVPPQLEAREKQKLNAINAKAYRGETLTDDEAKLFYEEIADLKKKQAYSNSFSYKLASSLIPNIAYSAKYGVTSGLTGGNFERGLVGAITQSMAQAVNETYNTYQAKQLAGDLVITEQGEVFFGNLQKNVWLTLWRAYATNLASSLSEKVGDSLTKETFDKIGASLTGDKKALFELLIGTGKRKNGFEEAMKKGFKQMAIEKFVDIASEDFEEYIEEPLKQILGANDNEYTFENLWKSFELPDLEEFLLTTGSVVTQGAVSNIAKKMGDRFKKAGIPDADINSYMRNRTEEQKRQDLLKVEALETQAEQAEYNHYLNKIKEQAIKAGQDTKVAENNATLIGEMINGIAALNNSSRISIAKKLSLDITNNAQNNNNENSFNQFVGEQSGYQSSLLNKAKQLSEQGLSNEDIRQQTGWFKGIDNKWRYEINDKDATIKEFNKTKNNLVLNDVLDFKELFNIYPFLNNTKIEFTNEGYSLTNPSTNTIQLSNNNFNKKTLLHEIQHLIQSEENFISGTTPQTYEAYKKAFENKYTKIYNNLFIKEFGKDFYNDFHSDKMNEGDFFDNFDNLLKKYNLTEQEYDNRNEKIQNEANEKSGLQYLKDKNIKNEYDFYNRFFGEVEAKNVENRSNLTEQERINTPIENTQDIKNSDAIVMFSDGTIIPYNANNQNNTLYQSFNQIAKENEELDRIYPAYEGDTIKINNIDKTVFNSKGERIAKSKEALENFYKWFGDSKVVDKKGRPLVVYHGSPAVNIETFEEGHINYNINKMEDARQGFYFTNNDHVAGTYANGTNTKNGKIYNVYLNLQNPLIVDYKKQLYDWKKNLNAIEKAKQNNNDGVIFKNIKDAVDFEENIPVSTSYVVFNSNQIKSVENNGNFSLDNNNIYYQSNNIDNFNVLDLTDKFDFIKSTNKEQIAQEIENYLNDLINKGGIDTNTPPLQVQITKDNKAHIKHSNLNLKGNQEVRLNSGLLSLENIINQAIKNNRDGAVDLSHNSSQKTLDHKKNIQEYVYFDSPIKINNDLYNVELTTERLKNRENKNLLDLYNVRVKKVASADNLMSLQPSNLNTIINNNNTNVKDINGKNALESYLEENGSNETFYQSDNNTNDKFLDTINKLENFIKENKNNEKIKQEDKQLEKEYKEISDINNINIVELIAKDRYEEHRNEILEVFKDNNIEKIREYFDVYGDSIENFLEDNDYDSNIEDYDNIDITQDMIDFAKKILLERVEEDLSNGYYEDDIDWRQQDEYYEKLTRDVKSLDDIFYDKLAIVSNILDDLGIENTLNQSRQSESTYLKVISKNNDDNNFEYRLSEHEDKHLDNAPSGGRRELSIYDSTIEIIEQIISDMQREHKYNNDVLYQQQSSKTPKGSIQFLGDKAVINLLTNADKSTLAHELSHYYLKLLEITAEAGTQEVKNKYNEVLNIFADESNAKGDYYSTQEKFARSWEAYLRRGIAPTTKLQSIFNDFRDWLANIYRSVKNLDITLSQDAIDFFNSILTPSDLSLQEQYENNYNKLKQEIQQEKDTLYQEQPNFTEEEINALLRERFMEQLTPLEDLQYKIERETNSTVKQKVNEIFKVFTYSNKEFNQLKQNVKENINNINKLIKKLKANKNNINIDTTDLGEDIDLTLNDLMELKKQAEARLPKQPETLIQWIKKRGGAYDEGGDLAQLEIKGLDRKSRYKKSIDINNRVNYGDLSLDAVRESAIESGFNIENGDDSSVADFLNAIREDASGNYQYKIQDADKVNAYNEAIERQSQAKELLSKLDIDVDELADLVNKAKKNNFVLYTKDKIDVIQAEAKQAINNIQNIIEEVKQQKNLTSDTLKEAFQNRQQEMKEVKNKVLDMLNNSNLEAKDKAKFLTILKNINTEAQFEEQKQFLIDRIKTYEDAQINRLIKNDIEKELKHTKDLKQNGRKVGRYQYQDNLLFNDLRSYDKMNKNQIAETLKNLMETTPDNEKNSMIYNIKERFLNYKLNGVNNSVDFSQQVLKDIIDFKNIALENKNEVDAIKYNNQFLESEELKNTIRKNDYNKDSLKTKLFNRFYLSKSGNQFDIMNYIFNKEIADKYNLEQSETNYKVDVYTRTSEMNKQLTNDYNIKENDLYLKNMELREKNYDLIINNQARALESGKPNVERISKMEIMDIYNSIRNEQKRQQFYKYYGQGQINDLIDNLTDADKSYADTLMDNVQNYDEINQFHIKYFNKDLKRETNYWPATSEHQKQTNILDINGASIIIDNNGVPTSFLKERVKGNVIPVVADAYNKAVDHINNTSYLLNMSEDFKKNLDIVNDNDIRSMIKNKLGDNIFNNYNDIIKGQSLMTKQAYRDINSTLFNKALNNWTVAKIAGNVSVFFKQLGAFSNYAVDTNASDFVQNLPYTLLHFREAYDFITSIPYFQERLNAGNNAELQRIMESSDASSKMNEYFKTLSKNINKKSIMDVFTSLQRYGDLTSVIIGGYTQYRTNIQLGMSQQQALQILEQSTTRTQQSGLKATRSNIQNNNSVFDKILSLFRSQTIQNKRNVMNAIIQYNRKEIPKGKLTKILVNYLFLQPLITLIMGKLAKGLITETGTLLGLRRKEPEEKQDTKETLTDMALNSLNTMLDDMPITETITNAVIKKSMGQKARNYELQLPMIDDITRTVGKIANKKNLDLMTFIDAVAPTVVETTTGLPVSTLQRQLNLLTNYKGK